MNLYFFKKVSNYTTMYLSSKQLFDTTFQFLQMAILASFIFYGKFRGFKSLDKRTKSIMTLVMIALNYINNCKWSSFVFKSPELCESEMFIQWTHLGQISSYEQHDNHYLTSIKYYTTQTWTLQTNWRWNKFQLSSSSVNNESNLFNFTKITPNQHKNADKFSRIAICFMMAIYNHFLYSWNDLKPFVSLLNHWHPIKSNTTNLRSKCYLNKLLNEKERLFISPN